MKSVREVLGSPGFKREVSILLLFSAAFNGLYTVIILAGQSPDPEVIALGVAAFILAAITLALAILIKRGSNKALLAAGVLFGLDTVLIFLTPLGEGVAGLLIWRGVLIYLLIRYIRRQRVAEI